MRVKYNNIIGLVLVNVIFITQLNAQYPKPFKQYRLNQFSTEDGLSQSNIYQILKDQEGFVWVVSEDGLNRFDGYTFKVFRSDETDSTSISDNWVWCLEEDSKGILWVGTNQGGLCKYDKSLGNFKNYLHDVADPQSLSQNTVTEIFEDSNGRHWIATHWGLNIFNPDTEKFIRIFSDDEDANSLLGNRIFSIVETTDKEIWVGTLNGISVFNLEGKFIKNYSTEVTEGFARGTITNLTIDGEGNVWASADGSGLLKYDKMSMRFKLYAHRYDDENSLANPYIRNLLIDSKDNFWVGMDGYGFQLFERSTGKFYSPFQNSNLPKDQIEKVYEIYEDDFHNLWFGAYGHGFFVLNEGSDNFLHYNHDITDQVSLSHNSVLCFAESKDQKIIIGTDGGGINIFDPAQQDFKYYTHDIDNPSSISGNVIKSVLFDSEGNLWAGTFKHGLNLKRKGTSGFERFTVENSGLSNGNIWALLEGKDKSIWVGTLGNGLGRYNPRTGLITHYEPQFDSDSTLSGPNIGFLMEDHRQQIWIGTLGQGISILNPETGVFRRLKNSVNDSLSLSHNEIRYIFQSTNDEVWVGTINGLNKYNSESNTFERFFEKDGLPSNVIKGIVEDEKGFLWLSTNNGVCKFDPKSKHVISFNRSDGLQGNEFNYNASLLSTNGTIYMGGTNGFNAFQPWLVKDDRSEPKVLFTKFSLFNKPSLISIEGPLTKDINIIEKIELRHDQHIFSIEFAAEEYKFPKLNKYQYKLEGFDPDWNDAGQVRSAHYTNLPAGDYGFLVRTTNNFGMWSSNVRRLKISVLPPWWQTNWAYSIILVMIFLIVYGIVRLRTSYLQAQKVRLRKLVMMRTKELEEKNDRISMQAEELNTFNDALNEVNENLENTVKKRTIELVKKNKVLADYAFLNAHNLRAPVANIKGLVQLFKFNISSEEKEEIIDKLKGQVEDVDAVLQEINDRIGNDQLLSDEGGKSSSQSANSSSSS